MIDLSEFTILGSNNREDENKTYVYASESDKTMYLRLGKKISEEAIKYFGNTCRVLVQPITGEVALCRGDSRRISKQGGDGPRYIIHLGAVRDEFIRHHGDFVKLYCDVRWENDEHGNKFVYCEPNGRIVRRSDAQ